MDDLRIVRGAPTEDELAALVCALLLVAEQGSADTRAAPQPVAARPSGWRPFGHRSPHSWSTPSVLRRLS
ncbi:acyl-CoA carboxylase epsilon subunit [Herbidospora mongoliensis]|uniref:acyl-CoA carboxylase epsilon subunit n=1 Tax=Herbidospora mongoliensis TaxID=688067 RepID=UPI000A6830CA|nr:acyl-CoA carboxylase epsilon subunit [Herbidospora mongoliensis]